MVFLRAWQVLQQLPAAMGYLPLGTGQVDLASPGCCYDGKHTASLWRTWTISLKGQLPCCCLGEVLRVIPSTTYFRLQLWSGIIGVVHTDGKCPDFECVPHS